MGIIPARELFDGDAKKFRLGIETMQLKLAYEYDPYFSLSIARADSLTHQLEAVSILINFKIYAPYSRCLFLLH
ncbi:hypothetical protein ACFLS9_08235 [Bacteroidota bacterium]